MMAIIWLFAKKSDVLQGRNDGAFVIVEDPVVFPHFTPYCPYFNG
jgi:hypothetical protein